MAQHVMRGQVALGTLMAAKYTGHVHSAVVLLQVDALDVSGQHEFQLRAIAAFGTRVYRNGHLVNVHVSVERLFVGERFLAHRARIFFHVRVFCQHVIVQVVLLRERLPAFGTLEFLLARSVRRHVSSDRLSNGTRRKYQKKNKTKSYPTGSFKARRLSQWLRRSFRTNNISFVGNEKTSESFDPYRFARCRK